MREEKQNHLIKYELRFSQGVEGEISKLVSQYGLKRDLTVSIFELIKTPDPKIVIFNLAKRIINKEGEFKDISETLKKELKIHQKDAEKLAHDIKDKILPLAEAIKPKETDVDELEPELSAQEIILEKIRENAPVEEVPPPPGVKKIEVTDVEKNAEALKKEKRRLALEEQEKKHREQYGKEDRYREPIK